MHENLATLTLLLATLFLLIFKQRALKQAMQFTPICERPAAAETIIFLLPKKLSLHLFESRHFYGKSGVESILQSSVASD